MKRGEPGPTAGRTWFSGNTLLKSRGYYALSKLRAVSIFRRHSLLSTLWPFALGISQMVERWRQPAMESKRTKYRAITTPERNPSGSEVDVPQRGAADAYYFYSCGY